jgi:hypothetical protein
MFNHQSIHFTSLRHANDLHIPPESIRGLSDMTASLGTLAFMMRNIYDLAISILPLVILHPKKLDGSIICWDLLITVSESNMMLSFLQ